MSDFIDTLKNWLASLFIGDGVGKFIRHLITAAAGAALGLGVNGKTLMDLVDPALLESFISSTTDLLTFIVLAVAGLYFSKKNKDKNA